MDTYSLQPPCGHYTNVEMLTESCKLPTLNDKVHCAGISETLQEDTMFAPENTTFVPSEGATLPSKGVFHILYKIVCGKFAIKQKYLETEFQAINNCMV